MLSFCSTYPFGLADCPPIVALVKPENRCHMSGMTDLIPPQARSPQAYRMSRARVGLAALGALLALGACAPGGWSDDGAGERRVAWLDYLGGYDLRSQCEIADTDAFRLVYREGARADINVLDVLTDEAGGAEVRHHRVGSVDMAGGAPLGPWREAGERSQLSPHDLSALVYWLDRLGLFSPEEAAPAAPGQELSWLISGCLNGSWFLNVHLPSAAATGLEVRFGPAWGGGGLSGRAPTGRSAGSAGRFGVGRPAPGAPPMASLGDPATVR